MWSDFVRACCVAAGLLCLAAAQDAFAHRVNVFAYVEGDTVHVECSYSRSDRVRFGEIDVTDAASGQSYLTGKTDAQGNFSFGVPEAARQAKADLRILLKAGEGHQNDWTVKYDEYAAAAPSSPARPEAASTLPAAAPATPQSPASAQAVTAAPADAAAMRALLETTVEAAVEKKIAPIRKILLDEKEKGPGFAEIFGGIGWLVGIAGLLAYVKSRHGKNA
jgi:nickel transport protein